MNAADRLKYFAGEVSRLRQASSPARSHLFSQALVALKQFQAQRLSQTHQDLLESSRYGLATRFFLEDLYGAKDFSQRDTELERVIPTLTRFLPESALATIADAVELDALSEDLDQKMTQFGLNHLGLDGLGQGWNAERYAAAYCGIGSLDERTEQLDLVPKIGRTLDKLVRSPLLGGLLSAMAGPARLAGVSTMHDFLTRGFKAFHSMKGSKEFLALIDERERALSKRWMAGEVVAGGGMPVSDGRFPKSA